MIKDNIRNLSLYENAHPEFKRAFKIILDTPADQPDGATEFDGIKRMVQSYTTRAAAEKRMETVRDEAQRTLIEAFGRDLVQIDEGEKP